MLIFVFGENVFSASEYVASMRAKFIDKFDKSGMNLVEFEPAKITLGDAMQAIASPPFISPKRMVILHGLLGEITRKAEIEPWIESLAKIPESTITILFDQIDIQKAQKHLLYKSLSVKPDVHTYPFPALLGSKLTAWAKSYSQKINLNISDQLLHKVVGLVGNDVWQLSLELQKLAAFASTQPVNDEMIANFVKANFEDQIFEFIDAVAQGQTERALKLLGEQRLAGSTDHHLFAMLARQVRLLLSATDVLERNPNATKSDIAKELDVHPFVAQKTLTQARRFNLAQMKRLHRLLFDLDLKLKRSQVKADVAVDRVVAELVS